MAITINGDTGISSIGALSGVTSISGTNATLTGVTSVASNAADTPVILQDSSSNSATCRAWVNFNGTGTVAIRADFNVSSITDNGTGLYTVNFTTAMPDANFATVFSYTNATSSAYGYMGATYNESTTSVSVSSRDSSAGYADRAGMSVAVLR